ncbi:MAG: beta-ketoacyl-ACP synthase III [Dysgonamonadaceae bacterium]|jgi:3-oxoacyl-[acyl-carrier-protein] synthase-3|nr:beta-ketoacyl-ACP synthase III [Dysgonamonadaceae bacterium]
MNSSIYITKISRFLPNTPVENEEMEQYLGMINNRPSLARRIVLRNNGIKQRYYALDKEGNITHTNVEMAAIAVRELFDEHFQADDIELLSAGTASPEQLIPSHGIMVHGLVGGTNAEVVSFAGSCCTGIQALKYAWLAMLAGDKNNAVCVASERLSAWMRARYFDGEAALLEQLEERPILAFEKEFLRWMLSDGAAAVRLEKEPAKEGLSLKIEWIDLCSFANVREVCMYAGGEKNEAGELVGWSSFSEQEWLSKSLFSLRQDTRMLGDNITQLGREFYVEVIKKHNLDINDVDWFLPHLSSMFFKDKIMAEFALCGYNIPEEKWFLNLSKIGNIASASNFLMLEELMRSGQLKKGQKILLMVPESARFSYGFSLLTVC